MCALASSDHTIHDYGTFGLWGSLLAGGDVVVSKGLSEDGMTADDYYYTIADFPWLYVDTRDPNVTNVLVFDKSSQQFINAP